MKFSNTSQASDAEKAYTTVDFPLQFLVEFTIVLPGF
jgi:hypothetical protein